MPDEFDFVYLRFDFGNCCNVRFRHGYGSSQVGYAFVNFTSVMALYNFVSAKVGKKWNMFSSEKVLQVRISMRAPLTGRCHTPIYSA